MRLLSLSRAKQGGVYHLHSLPQLRLNRRWPRGNGNGTAAVVSCMRFCVVAFHDLVPLF